MEQIRAPTLAVLSHPWAEDAAGDGRRQAAADLEGWCMKVWVVDEFRVRDVWSRGVHAG